MALPIKMNLTFFRTPKTPTTDNIYWCIVKAKDIKNDTTEFHYSFIEFKEDWAMPVLEGFVFTIMAWCVLENPGKHFVQPRKIISIAP